MCVFSSRYPDISLAKKKLQYLQKYMICLIYILLVVPIVRFRNFLELQLTGSISTDK
jgi:hypothetical protein